MTKAETAEFLRVSQSTLFRNKKILPKPVKIGTKVFYRLGEINKFLDQQNAK